jgi:molecular chaperone HscA
MKLYDIMEPGEAGNSDNINYVESDEAVVGIDLGTTHSLIAHMADDEVQIIKTEGESTLLPSAVLWQGEGFTVGSDALRGEAITSAKRLMGRGSKHREEFSSEFPIADSSDEKMLRIQHQGREVSAIEAAAAILSKLKAVAETQLNKQVNKAVITVPAYFDNPARSATMQAATIAGLEVLRLISEPTAAAYAYGLENQTQGSCLVFDLGGGTFDVSILQMQQGVFQVVATCGDTRLGGDDFDLALLELLREKSQQAAKLPSWQLKQLAKTAKEEMCQKDTITLTIGTDIISISYQEFLAASQKLIKRIMSILRKSLRDANISKDEIEHIILVGGASRMRFIASELKKFFGKPPLTNLNPDEIVAAGAARQAQSLGLGADTLLLDVTPLSLGIELMDDIAEIIIPRNAPIPVEFSREFTTHQDGQTGFLIHVIQGESEKASECRSLARFEMKGLQPLPKGQVKVKVTFKMDADGLLVVKAVDSITTEEYEIVVRPSYGLSEEETRRLLSNCL